MFGYILSDRKFFVYFFYIDLLGSYDFVYRDWEFCVYICYVGVGVNSWFDLRGSFYYKLVCFGQVGEVIS